MTLLIEKPTGAKLNLRKTWQPMDPDAAAYITAVETADGQALEEKTKIAIDNFVLGCKADGIWSAIRASCILAGARTLEGALVPLAGTAPTNFNFVSGDYNRKTGLVGNRSNKSLRTGLLASALGNTSHHLFYNGSSFATGVSSPARNLGGIYDGSNISSLLDLIESEVNNRREIRSGTAGGSAGNSATISSGLIASGSISGSRTSATDLRLYQNGASVAVAANSNTPSLPNIAFGIFARNNNGTQVEFVDSRLNFFSIGDGLGQTPMAALHARVTDLINAFAAAIP
jgi:hypothetical protein